MGEQEETTLTNRNPKTPSLCEECKANPSKYKCPGCSIRSCSLPCIKAHKLRTDCTGKRQLTQFVPLSQFDDNLLISDYNMLEDVKRVAESAQRMRVKMCGFSQSRLPFPLKSLRSAAATRRTRMLFLSSGMSKRETNSSFYDNRKKFISWTIEWRFHSTDVVLIDHGVLEHTNLCAVIENHLKPGPWNHRLKQFCEEPLESLKFFIRKYPKGPRSPFRELDIKAPIREQLANLVIMEYPVIHVFLPSHSYDFEVIKNVIPHKLELKESVSNREPSPKGVSFREEEIEDDSSLDPRVLDLMKHVKPDRAFQTPHETIGTERELNDTFNRPQGSKSVIKKYAYIHEAGKNNLHSSSFRTPHQIIGTERQLNDTFDRPHGSKPVIKNDVYIHEAEDNNLHSSSNTKEPGVFENMDFDFEQGLIDVYSDLMSETNPDDFLDLEGMLTEEVKLEERIDQAGFSGVFPLEEELEEGEIPGF